MDSSSTILKKIKAFLNGVLSFFIDFYKNSKRRKKQFRQDELDKKLVYSMSKSRIPSLAQLKYIKKYLSPKELLVIYISFFIIIVSTLFGGTSFYLKHLELVPKAGGKYIEGSIGSPKYINPLYASLSDTDLDISSLVYSSLFKIDKTGNLKTDLVETQTVSDDHKVYTYQIKDKVFWHDGEELTADDVVFTFNLIKDPAYKSPLRASFTGVGIEKQDDLTVKFTLTDPYVAFDELLTFGIMPAHVWGAISAEAISLADYNLRPIGSGPYKSKQLVKDKLGNIKEYDLSINEDYYGELAKVDVSFKFFESFEEAIAALNDNLVNGISYLPNELRKNIITPKTYNFYKLSLPQLTAIFFNSNNNSALTSVKLRKVLSYAIDKTNLVDNVLEGNAKIVDGPILADSFAYNTEVEKYNYNPEEAKKLLTEDKWESATISEEEITTLNDKKTKAETEDGEALTESENKKLAMGAGNWLIKNGDYLKIKLTTVETSENTLVVEAVKKYWEELGIKTELEILPLTQVQNEVIKGRNFEALFYGQVLGVDPDPYAFWHSSQTGETGFNIANFANKEVDELLEDARTNTDPIERKAKYSRFQEIVSENAPVVFMYSPTYTYLQDKKIKGFDVTRIIDPRDRFANIEEWYINTRKKLVW